MDILNNKPFFRGRSLHRLDTKGRLRIPTKFREVLQNHYTDALVLVQLGKSLVAYPPEKWNEIESKASGLSQVNTEHRAFLRFISGAELCEFDNQGRILIPPMLRKEAGIGEEVMLAGVLTNIEIWDKDAWDKQADLDTQNFPQIMETIAGTGL